MPVVGIDIGTQSLKAVVVDDAMRLRGAGSVAYQPTIPGPGKAEQDPQLWLDALGPAIAAALTEARLLPRDIAAVCVCGQLDGCVPTASDGRVVGPAIIWMDRRAEPLLQVIDASIVATRCGLVCDATHMGAKIKWSIANGILAETWHQPVSFIVAALTGERVMSHSLASTTMLYDVRKRNWGDGLLDLFGTRRQQLPAIAPEADVAGRLTERGVELTGLLAGTPIAVGTGDDFSNLLGCGISQAGIVGVSLGTAEAIGTISSKQIFDPGLLVETHAFPDGGFHLGNPGWLGGGSVRWAAQMLGMTEANFTEVARDAPAGCEGLTFIPALSGAMAPRWIAEASGTFVGLSLRHGRAHMARAVLEGTAFAMRDVVDRLGTLGVQTDRLRLMGGGARNAIWCQMRCDVSGRPADALTDSDASAMGAAVLAAVAAGSIPDITTGCSALALDLTTFEPDDQPRSAYDDAYAAYRSAFDTLEPYWVSTSRPLRDDS
jgi:xylulokinase